MLAFFKIENNNAYAVTMQCILTKYVVIAPIPNKKKALTVAKAIVEPFIGSMKKIRSDMGPKTNRKFYKNCPIFYIIFKSFRQHIITRVLVKVSGIRKL